MAQMGGEPPTSSNAHRDSVLEPKHKVFLSHSGAQKSFVESLCVELERHIRFSFFDNRRTSLPIGESVPKLIFDAINQCYLGVVILSDEFFTSKWAMIELVALVNRLHSEQIGKSFFRILPVFYRTSPEDIRNDAMKWDHWVSCWENWAKEDKRVHVPEHKAALRYLLSIDGLVFNGVSELRFLEETVDAICRLVPEKIGFEDSHIQGRSRICQVIREKIDVIQEEDDINGICVVGLYGMAGIGKTSICKVLCNEFFAKFRGRVCHAELGSTSEEELLRIVLTIFTNTRTDVLDRCNADELHYLLRNGIKDPVFLALDNVSDFYSSIHEAKSYLEGRLPPGSIVMVTSRSKDSLMRLSPFIDETRCLEMPELALEEATAIFVESSNFYVRNESDEQLLNRCVKQCYFEKGDNSKNYHYHPLALKVLGITLGDIDPEEWGPLLDKTGEIIFDEATHPIYSILRSSFDTLSWENQLLFMDVALFLPEDYKEHDIGGVYEWLCIVHGIRSVDNVRRRLLRLKQNSLLEINLDNGSDTRIGMHPLWRSFCVAETKSLKLERQRWVYEAENRCKLVEASPSGPIWHAVERMAFLDCKLISLDRVNFAHFSNVKVLKITGVCMTKKLVLDLSGLIHLKSLEVSGEHLHRLELQGLPRGLIFLSLKSGPSQQSVTQVGGVQDHSQSRPNAEHLIKQIGCLAELRSLLLVGYEGKELPDMRRLVSMQKAAFVNCANVVTLTGLNSKLTNFRVLELRGCTKLRSCPGAGDLMNLEELNYRGCNSLVRLPNVRKLRKLRKLNVSGCDLIREIPGIDDAGALEELYAGGVPFIHSNIFKLPDMRKLVNLQVLHLRYCTLEAVPGIDSLISLQEIVADFRALTVWPNIERLTMLQKIEIDGWSSEGLRGLNNMVMLHTLVIRYCGGVDALPDFRSLKRLKRLSIQACDFKDVSTLSNLSALETLSIDKCKQLENVPDFQGLTRLRSLLIRDCAMLRSSDCTFEHGVGSSHMLNNTIDRSDPLDSQMVSESFKGSLKDCLEETMRSVKKHLSDMEELLKKVRIWHYQCKHLLDKYRGGVGMILQVLEALIEVGEGPLNGPKARLICSKVICCMLEGKALVLFCGENGYNKAAFALSSPRSPSVATISRFGLVLRELDWTRDFIWFIGQSYVHGNSTFGDWKWCEKSCRLRYDQGDSMLKLDDSLEGDSYRQSDDQNAFLASLDTPPSSEGIFFIFRFFQILCEGIFFIFRFFRTLCGRPREKVYQDELTGIWTKRLLATSHTSTSSSAPCDWSYIDKTEFEDVRIVASGGFKTVNVCKWLGEQVAVALLTLPQADAEAEADLLARVQHPNVVELMGYAYKDDVPDPRGFLVTEFMEQDLDSLIKQQWPETTTKGRPFALLVAVDIVLQIVEAMIHLKECRVFHRDLKPKNCLASPKYMMDSMSSKCLHIPTYYTIKLIDFGTAKFREQGSYCHTYKRGTPYYMAPEVYGTSEEARPYTWSADVYSFAMTCYEVFTGRAPFQTYTKFVDVQKIILGGQRPSFPLQVPSFVKDLIERCWAPNPDDRPTFQEIRRDLWQFKLYAST